MLDLQQFKPIDPVRVFKDSSEAHIECVPPYGVPVPTVSWKKNGKEINNTRITSDTSKLVIKNVVEDDAGNYTCYAKNMAKERNVTVTLEVVSKYTLLFCIVFNRNITYHFCVISRVWGSLSGVWGEFLLIWLI